MMYFLSYLLHMIPICLVSLFDPALHCNGGTLIGMTHMGNRQDTVKGRV